MTGGHIFGTVGGISARQQLAEDRKEVRKGVMPPAGQISVPGRGNSKNKNPGAGASWHIERVRRTADRE